MTRTELQASLVLWRRRHAFRQHRLDAANQRDDAAGILKWQRLRREAGAMIDRRKRQLAALDAIGHPGQLWMPGATRRSKSGCGAMFQGYSAKGVLHTTEGSTLQSALDALALHNSWPHFCVDRDGSTLQHIPLNQGARALEHPGGTAETNRGGAIQIEVVGFAGHPDDWPTAQRDAVRRVMRFIETSAGVQRHSDLTFHDSTHVQRMGDTAWHGFDGWCGHQHVPHQP